MWSPFKTILIASLLAAPAFSEQSPFAVERYRVTLEGGGLGVEVDDVIIVSAQMNSGGEDRWIAERLRRDRSFCIKKIGGRCVSGETAVHTWIDGRTCPALTAVFDDLAQVEVSGFAPPARSARAEVTDTPMLTVSGTPDRMRADGARLSLAGFDGPVVDWWSRSQGPLAACWSARIPTSNGQPFEPRLSAR